MGGLFSSSLVDIALAGLELGALSGLDKEALFRLFSSFMDQIPAGIIIKDSSLRYVYVNRYLKNLYGISLWEGGRAEELYPGDPAVAEIEDEDRRALQGGSIEVFVTIPDSFGVSRRFRITKFPIDLAGGERMLGYIMTDITELAKMQNELAAAAADREKLLKEARDRSMS
ncbi:MAG TPA: PAS domain-containing protein [Rectinemataceae bacterium]|nr:PAS domain-containing protein [Rectinemataceae bacterium]